MEGLEFLLVFAGVIIAIVLFLYLKERMMLKKYYELIEEKGKIDKLSKQVQLDYYKRRLTEDTLRKVLADYNEKNRILEQEIDAIEEKHGIMSKKSGLERHLDKAVSSKKPEKSVDLGKLEEEIK
jgi:uncharacterized membrane protein YgaE (UPF0421/DUF939 family)